MAITIYGYTDIKALEEAEEELKKAEANLIAAKEAAVNHYHATVRPDPEELMG